MNRFNYREYIDLFQSPTSVPSTDCRTPSAFYEKTPSDSWCSLNRFLAEQLPYRRPKIYSPRAVFTVYGHAIVNPARTLGIYEGEKILLFTI